MRSPLLLGLAMLVLYVAGATVAEECVPTTSDPEVAVADQYIDNDVCQPECVFSVWHYFESNGIEGLQRGDEMHDDTCGGMIESDSIICALLPVGLMPRRREDARRANGAALAGAAVLGGVAFLPTADAC